METIYIKKQQVAAQWLFVVPAVGIKTKEGIRLIPHPYGTETTGFDSIEAAVDQVHHAGYAAEFEGRHYPLPARKSSSSRPAKTAARSSDSMGMQVLQKAIPLLLEQLKDNAPGVVASAAYALGECHYEGAIPGLIHAFSNEDVTVRKSAAEALAKIGRSALSAIHQSMRDKHWLVRHTALTTLSELLHSAPDLALEILADAQPLLKDESWLVRSQAATLFGEAAKRFRELEEKKR